MFSNLVTASQLASSSLALSLSFGELTRYFATTTTTTAPAAAVVVGVIYHVIQLTIATKDDEESFLAQFNQLAARGLHSNALVYVYSAHLASIDPVSRIRLYLFTLLG